MNAYIVLVSGHVHSVWTSPVDSHLVAKPLLNAMVETCRLNSEVLKLESDSDVEVPVAASAPAPTPKIEPRRAAGSST